LAGQRGGGGQATPPFTNHGGGEGGKREKTFWCKLLEKREGGGGNGREKNLPSFFPVEGEGKGEGNIVNLRGKEGKVEGKKRLHSIAEPSFHGGKGRQLIKKEGRRKTTTTYYY